MNDWTWLRPTATGLAAASFLFVLLNGALVLRNDNAQARVNQRQQFINQGVAVSRAARFMVQTIARVAATTKDDALIQLLERHGMHLTPDAPAAGEGKVPGAAPSDEISPMEPGK
ncbi:MAG TPA: hypothetical protein VMU87_10255 [Stellaceae bacterium]|nr:hypothetical protein [Stellaceae bacterium]